MIIIIDRYIEFTLSPVIIYQVYTSMTNVVEKYKREKKITKKNI